MATESTADKDKRIFTYDLLEIRISESEKSVSCKLKIPSKLPPRYESKDQGNNPMVFLDIKSSNTDGNRCFQIMKEIIHDNILHARGITEINSQLLLWVEPYNGNLLEFLEVSLWSNCFSNQSTTVLPTVDIQMIVSQIIDGLNYLRIQGCYHGNLTMEGTYFYKTKVKMFVKLANFGERSKTKSVCQHQLEDLKDLGKELVVMSSKAQTLNKASKSGQIFDTYILDDLGKRLNLITQRNLVKAYETIKKHPFFWGIHERKKFFIYRVALKMKTPKFRSKVEKCKELCSIPWNTKAYNGFLQMMNQFRSRNNEPHYNGMSKCEFVLFICGLYTHEHEPPLSTNGKRVDDTVTRNHPHVCLVLSNLLQDGEDDDWL